MAAEIQASGGTVEKFAGDAVMAAFGAPEALEDHAERALHTALALQRRIEPGLTLRIGVNTGEVVAGRAREGSSFVSGDAVNVAARLEQAAEPGEILVGERTAAAARGAFEFGGERTVEAKGKLGGVRARPLVRALSLMRTRGVGGLARTFVGRDAELARLQAAYRRAVEHGHPVLVTVLGDAGLGKTRLMRELWEHLDEEQPQPLRRVGRCLPYGEGITYWPLGEILKEHLSLLDSDPPEEAERRLGEQRILGLTLGLDVAGDMHPLAARDRLQTAWATFLTELAAQQPVVVLVEDAHWAETPLLDLLERVTRDVDGPLLLLVTARPDFARAWDPRIDAETIWLEPLPQDTTSTLVASLLAADVAADVRQLVVERAEGNPFFVEEVLGSLIDAGVLQRTNGSWRTAELPPGFRIPDSVQAVLAARIDLLDEAEKAALQSAAVIGRAFWTGPVYELVAGLEPDLGVLESRDFVRRRATSTLEGEVEYVFKHALTREVAYAGLTKPRRARLHAQFAGWIERLGEGRDDHAPLLAHHYAEAVRPEDADLCWRDEPDELARLRANAVSWLERAAELAVGRYEIDDGVALLHRALDLEADEVRQSQLWRKVGLANSLKFDGQAFWTAMQRSLAVCHDREICANTYADLALQTAIRSGMWPQRPQRELVQGWIDQALKLASPGSAAQAKALIADCFWNQQAGREAADEAHSLSERLGDVQLRAYALNALGWIAFAEQEYAEAAGWAERALGLVDEISDPDHLADVYEAAIPAFSGIGYLGEARRLAALHGQVVQPLTPHHRLHGVSVQLEVEELCANWEGILASSGRTVATVDENLATPCIRNARSLLVTAVAAAETGDPERADALESRALEVALEGYDFVLAAPRARLALSRGDGAAAVALVPELRDFRMSFVLAHASARLDSLAAAGELEAVERESSLHLRPGAYTEPFAQRALAIVHEDEELLAQAEKLFGALGLDWHAGQTDRLRRLRERAT